MQLVSRHLILALGFSLLSGCAGDAAVASYHAAFRIKIADASTLTAHELQQLQQLQFLGRESGLTFKSLGPVRGLSCRTLGGWILPPLSDLNGRMPEAAAMMQMKIKATRLGANGILAAACAHQEFVDLANDCFESWVCEGEAVRVE